MVAPQGAGKSRHAAALAELFGCTTVVDEWDGGPVPDGALVLTQVESFAAAGAVLAVDTRAGHVAASVDAPVRRCRPPFSREFRDCLCPVGIRDKDDCRHPL